MPLSSPSRLRRLTGLIASSLSCAFLAAGCGGGGDATADTSGPTGSGATTSNALAGTVAVGAPITNGKLRVLDANGALVAADVAIDADGHYADVALTGPAPYRLEACGYAGPNYLCVYSVVGGAGTANVTPLTTATMLLATGQSPDSMMSGAAPGLTADGVAAAQAQLRTSLASVLAGAGASGTLDFVSGSLAAGSRSGYDGVLDAIGITIGQDAKPFVQVTPRLGQGNLYLEQGLSSGSVTSADASTLQLSGLEVLFRNMTASLASASACASETTGLRRSLAANAQMTLEGGSAQGANNVAQALCGFFATGEGGTTAMWGSTLLSPTLGRCDLSGAAPVCNVSFVLKSPDGEVMPVGNGMGVTQEGGAWKFMGDLLPIEIHASAKAQRTKRIDTTEAIYDYSRALAFEVAAVSGLACAKVAQRNSDGAQVVIGYYKRHPDATEQRSLSLWTADGFGDRASADPLVGFTRSGDDTWIGLPERAEGDAVIRNFYRGGRSVVVSLYADAACGTPFMVAGRSEFEVEVDGVPPVWSAMATLPWPEVDATTQGLVRNLALAGDATGSLHAAWSFARGPLGLNGVTVCGSRDSCGRGDSGRLGDGSLRPSARDATVALRNTGMAIAADDPKTLALYGRNGEGVDLQSNYSSCPLVPAADSCR